MVAVTGESADTADALTAALAAARDGDDDAFRMVYRLVQPSLLRYLNTLIRRDAEDIASEAWLQIARSAEVSR